MWDNRHSTKKGGSMPSRRKVVLVASRKTVGKLNVNDVIDQLVGHGFEVNVEEYFNPPLFGSNSHARVKPDTEIVVVLGGDGTMLRAAELVHGTDVPIVGINMGHVGFLAEFERFQIQDALAKIASRDYSIDERVVAQVAVTIPHQSTPIMDWALNDVTIENAERGRMLEIAIAVDDVDVSSFGCDGVIISTPTGSTAYAFSAGGPVIWPEVGALQLVPLAAHALFARPLIIGAQSTFSIHIPHSDQSTQAATQAWICADGRRQQVLPQGSTIDVHQSSQTVKLARLIGIPFSSRLVSKFDLPVRGWRQGSAQHTLNDSEKK